MSKETYLKGEDKENVLDLIRKCMAFRFNDNETLEFLVDNEILISCRTIRRFKQEISEIDGSSIADVYRNHIVNSVIQDVLSFEEIQKQSWKMFFEAKTIREKIQSLNCLKGASAEKLKLYENMPKKFRIEQYRAEREKQEKAKEVESQNLAN